MRRRLAVIGAVVCVLGIAACAGLWVRSCFWSDQIYYAVPRTAFGVSWSSSSWNIFLDRTASPTPWGIGWQWMGHPHRQLFGGGHPFDGIVNFACRTSTIPVRGGAKATVVGAPFWFPMLILGFVAWRCVRIAGNVRFAVRDDITWIKPALKTKMLRFAIFCAAGIGIGALVEGLNIAVNMQHSAAQLTITGFAALGLISLLIVTTRRRIQWHRAILWLLLEVAGCVCFFAATMERIWFWFGRYGSNEPDVLQAALVFGVGAFLGGAILLRFLQLKPAILTPGPYCRSCGYCLIGVPGRICPECGRGFTVEELGISEVELDARSRALG